MNLDSNKPSWDPSWEKVFRSRDWGKYPPEELIRLVARNFYSVPDRSAVKFLELGCGAGANIWFMAREGFTTYGIDGSTTAIAKTKELLDTEHLSARLTIGDVAELEQLFPSPSQFDAVVDICCLQHNRLSQVTEILRQVFVVLKPGGKIFSMLLAEDSQSEATGREIEPRTFVDITEGSYAGIGLSRFFTLKEVEELFSAFTELQIEYSVRSSNQRKHINKHWMVQASKPN